MAIALPGHEDDSLSSSRCHKKGTCTAITPNEPLSPRWKDNAPKLQCDSEMATHKNCNRISHFHRSFLCVLLWAKSHLLRPPCGLYFKWLTTSMASLCGPHVPDRRTLIREGSTKSRRNLYRCYEISQLVTVSKLNQITLFTWEKYTKLFWDQHWA